MISLQLYLVDIVVLGHPLRRNSLHLLLQKGLLHWKASVIYVEKAPMALKKAVLVAALIFVLKATIVQQEVLFPTKIPVA